MQPAKQTDSAIAARQDMLEKSADQLVSFQVDGLPLAGFGIAVGPAHFAVGQEMDGAIGRGRFEDITGKITQRVFSRTGRLTMHDPGLFPNFGRDLCEEIGMVFEQSLPEEGAEMSAQRFDGEQVVVLGSNPGSAIQAQSTGGNQEMDVGMENEGPRPGVHDAQHAQLRAQSFGMGGQILERLGAGAEEHIQAVLQMGSDPRTQRFGHGESHQEIGDRQQQPLPLAGQPIVGVGLPALRAVAVVAGMILVVELAALGAPEQLAAQSRGAAAQQALQHLAQTPRHGRSKPFQIAPSKFQQELMEFKRTTATRISGSAVHGNSALQIAHELIQAFLMLGFAEAGQMSVEGGDGRALVAEVDLDLPEVLALLKKMSGVTMA